MTFAIGSVPALAEPLMSPGYLAGGEVAVVQDIEPGADLRLADGRLVRLAGIDAGDDASSLPRADRLRRWLTGRPVRIVPLGPGPDRWGRTAAAVFAAGGEDGPAVSVAEALLDAGLARARPNPAISPCWGVYLRLETSAREERRGLWAESEAGIITAGDAAALQSQRGRFVLIEGTIDNVFEGRSRTYLRFGGDFAASFERRVGTRLAKAGLVPESWRYRRVRIRGVLDDRWGLQIEIASPEQIEVLPP